MTTPKIGGFSYESDMWRIKNLPVTASTNDEAWQAAEAGEPAGFVIQALRQTSGRGRHGRVWESPEGNLYCSILLRPSEGARHYGWYSFVAALAVGDAAQAALPSSVTIALKWPNDVLVDGKKIAGILLEGSADFLIIGIGLNVTHHPEGAMVEATSLHKFGFRDEVVCVRDHLLERLQHWQGLLHTQGFQAIRAAWLERAHQGEMTVKLPKETLQGTMLGLDDSGALRLRLADGVIRVIEAGDAFFDGTENAARD
jgi:BirA family biotin operon repressor/biotin-[acetyl-CoA-carboxylase] ligase